MCSSQEVNISSEGSEFPPEATTVLYYVYQCLFSPGVTETVTSSILDMTLDLLDGRDMQATTSQEVVYMYVYTIALFSFLKST